MKRESIVIWWLKRDLRLADNLALEAARASGLPVLALYLFEPSIEASPDYSDFHLAAIQSALQALQCEIEGLDGYLLTVRAEFEEVIEAIKRVVNVQAIFSYEETGLAVSFERDKRVGGYLKQCGIHWQEFPTNGVIRKLANRNKRSKVWKQRMTAYPTERPGQIRFSPELQKALVALPFEKNIWDRNTTHKVTESDAWKTLDSFLLERGIGYSGGISSPNTAFSVGSRLSTHLAWGTISLRQVFHALRDRQAVLRGRHSEDGFRWRRSLRAFESRLHWHDHFIQRLESEPEMEFRALNPIYRDIPYERDEQKLLAWLAGETGEPLIDACMRCLQAEGFLNFRMRAVVVSYAVHVLHLSWQDILYPLAKLFVDYEPGIHVSQIQMQAGVVGINTVRVYNPYKQMIDQDSELHFVRRWVPELSTASDATICNYRKQKINGYPKPIVDYNRRNREMKDMLYTLKKSAAAKAENAKVLEKHGSKFRRQRHAKDTRQLSLLEGEQDAAR